MEDHFEGSFMVNMYCILGQTSAHTNHRRNSIVIENASFPHTCTGVPLICGILSIPEWLAAHALAPLYMQL